MTGIAKQRTEDGGWAHEVALDDEGRWHGLEREWQDGRLVYHARFVHGVQHGLQEQWSARGSLLVRQRFVHGTGLDLYSDGTGGWEERWLERGERHGFERWWSSKRRIWRESHFARELSHGIEREWDGERLLRGFPRFFVRGERVTKAAYLRACAADPTLPAYRDRDDRPTRRFPAAIVR